MKLNTNILQEKEIDTPSPCSLYLFVENIYMQITRFSLTASSLSSTHTHTFHMKKQKPHEFFIISYKLPNKNTCSDEINIPLPCGLSSFSQKPTGKIIYCQGVVSHC